MQGIRQEDYVVDIETGCWLWTRSRNTYGYAQKAMPGYSSPRGVHVIAYESKYGPVPAGLTLDHKCRTRHCINPEHLEVVTRGENVRRGDRAILDWPAAREIRRLYASGKHTQAAIASRFGVCKTTVNHIINNRRWQIEHDPAQAIQDRRTA